MQIFELQQVVVEVTVKFAAFGPFRDEPLNFHEATTGVVLAQSIEAKTEFRGENSHGIVALEVQPVVICAGQIEHLAKPADTIGAEDTVPPLAR